MTVLELMNYQPSVRFAGEWVASIRWANEYQCERRLMRVLSYSAYAQPMGRGPATFAGDQQAGWVDVPSGSLAEDVLQTICAR